LQPALSHDSSATECAAWLRHNLFSNYIKDFSDFSGKQFAFLCPFTICRAVIFYVIFLGADLLNLTRADLIDICGIANGIRLYNTLHGK